MHVALFQPEIPPNTGNIGRTCVSTDTRLHLIKPLGFSLRDRDLKRAGLDYWPHLRLSVWESWQDFTRGPGQKHPLVLTSSNFSPSLYSYSFSGEEILVFGPEAEGLPGWLLEQSPGDRIRVPVWGSVRSLNLATAVSVCLFEAYRQTSDLTRL